VIAPYAKIVRTFWTDPEVRALTSGQKMLLLYYLTGPRGNMAGLYYQPFDLTATETRLDDHTVKRWTLQTFSCWMTYDLRTAEVLVHNAARFAVDKGPAGGPGGPLLESDARHKGLLRQVLAAHSQKLQDKFAQLYKDWPLGGAVEAALRARNGARGSTQVRPPPNQ
jgi:hypothetical protein